MQYVCVHVLHTYMYACTNIHICMHIKGTPKINLGWCNFHAPHFPSVQWGTPRSIQPSHLTPHPNNPLILMHGMHLGRPHMPDHDLLQNTLVIPKGKKKKTKYVRVYDCIHKYIYVCIHRVRLSQFSLYNFHAPHVSSVQWGTPRYTYDQSNLVIDSPHQ